MNNEQSTQIRSRIVFINVALDKKNHVTYPSHFWSQERCHFVTRAHMYYCMYFYPNVYSLKLVKHRVIFFIYYWVIFFNYVYIYKNYSSYFLDLFSTIKKNSFNMKGTRKFNLIKRFHISLYSISNQLLR